jgi:hypothetical protein
MRRCYTPPIVKAHRVVFLLLAILTSQAFLGCGSSISSPSYTALNGVWNISGNRALNQYPLLSLSLIVNGDQVTAQGDLAYQCGLFTVAGTSVSLSGQIASDGTFQLVEPANLNPLNPDPIELVLNGSVPVSGKPGWTGGYSLNGGQAPCTFSQGTAFIATALAPLNGTYSGTLTLTSGNNITVSTTISQGQPTAAYNSLPGYMPLTGTISVLGTPCFSSGTASIPLPGVASPLSQIVGDMPIVSFSMNDGSTATLQGYYDGPDESSLQEVSFHVQDGQCNGQVAAFGTLTRQ